MHHSPVDNSHFEYMKVVGKGGFGKVNAVIKKSSNEFFAIKRVNKFEVLKKDPTLYTVGIEFDIMTRVQSPFCLHLVHAFQTETELCMVMPFMRGALFAVDILISVIFTGFSARNAVATFLL
jgi:serine/threonine protein kinase